MKTLLLLAALATHSLTDQPESPRELEKAATVSAELTRGYFAMKDGKLAEDHKNVIERAVYRGGRLAALTEVGLLDTTYRFEEYRDGAGRVTESTILRGGSLHAAESRAYDPKGRLVDWKTFDDNGDLTLRRRHVYKGKLLIAQDVFAQTRAADDVVLLERHVYTYDKAGKLNQMTTYRMFPKKRVAAVAVYDTRGRMTTEAVYDEWGEIDAEFAYEYEDGPDGLWTKRLKLKKVRSGDEARLVPVDVLYRAFSTPPAEQP